MELKVAKWEWRMLPHSQECRNDDGGRGRGQGIEGADVGADDPPTFQRMQEC